MGLFSSKKKTIVGIANSKLIPEGEAPQALKDSVAGYIADYGASNGQVAGTMVSYINDGIDKSIVHGVKRLNRWVKKPGMYDAVGSIVGQMSLVTDADVRSMVALNIENQYSHPIKFYYLNNVVYDLGHLTKQVLQDRYTYIPSDNTLTYKGSIFYLEDAVITTAAETNLEEMFPPGFTAGVTPYRAWDSTRTYTESNLITDPTKQFDYFEVTAVNEFSIDTIESITTITVVTNPPVTDPPEEPTTVTTIVSGGTEVINNIPLEGIDSQVYERTENMIEEVSTEEVIDGVSGTVTTTVKSMLITKEFYRCTAVFRDTFSSYLFSQNIDLDTLTEEEARDLIGDIALPALRIQVGYEYQNSEGKTIVVYKTLTEEETGYVDGADSKKPFGNFMPNLYFKVNWEYIDKDKLSPLYKQSKRYASKIGLTYKDLSKQLKEEVKDQDKIPYAYMKFGVNFASTSEVDMTYLFYFFQKYFLYCDSEDLYGKDFPYELDTIYEVAGKYLNFADKLLRYDLSTTSISYYRGTESINPIGTITRYVGRPPLPEPTGNKWIDFINIVRRKRFTAFRRQITEDTYEEYRVVEVKANQQVTGDKWAQSGGEGSHLLVPVDFDLVNRLKGFKAKERFLYNSMYVEFLTLVVKKVRWYQRGVFKLIIFAVSVAITVLTGGAGVTVASVLMASLTSLAIGIAIDITIKLLLKVLSPELLKILGIALIAAGLIAGQTSALKGLQQFSTKAFTILTMKADLLVKFGVKLVNSATNQQMANIQDSFLKESKAYQEKMEALDKYKLDNQKYRPNPQLTYLDEDIRYAPVNVGESIDALIARSLNTNPALVAINYTHNYVEFILGLPTPSETVYRPIEDE